MLASRILRSPLAPTPLSNFSAEYAPVRGHVRTQATCLAACGGKGHAPCAQTGTGKWCTGRRTFACGSPPSKTPLASEPQKSRGTSPPHPPGIAPGHAASRQHMACRSTIVYALLDVISARQGFPQRRGWCGGAPRHLAMVTFKDLADDSSKPLDLASEVDRLRLQVHLAESGYQGPVPLADQSP